MFDGFGKQNSMSTPTPGHTNFLPSTNVLFTVVSLHYVSFFEWKHSLDIGKRLRKHTAGFIHMLLTL